MKNYRSLLLITIILAISIWLVLPNNPGLFGREIKTHLGLDLVGGVQVLLEADVAEGTNIDSESMNTARRIIENRVNGLGVSEASVQSVGSRRVSVELPGLEDPQQAIDTVKSTGLLEFVDMSSINQNQAITLVGSRIQTDGVAISNNPTAVLTDTNPLTSQVWHTVMTGKSLREVTVTTNQVGQYEVSFALDSEGAKTFSDFTSNNVGKVLAIVLDKEVISVPVINDAITDGQGVIQNSQFTVESANQLAVQLRYGSLPIPFKVVEVRSIGPTLGQDSLQKSMVAGVIGAIVVILFMLLYYRLPGGVAAVAILIYAVVTFALYRLIPVTLTLPGIAGFLLSTGSALDANILIFERMKEELRDGRSLWNAINQGWERAWPSIRDSNFATLLICLILAVFGSQSGATIVIGFAFTLGVGVAVSLFSAFLVTRTLLDLVVNSLKPTDLETWFGI